MNLLKYLSKLQKMSTAEITFRLQQTARNRLEVLRLRLNSSDKTGNDLFVPAWIKNWSLQTHPFPAESVSFFALTDDAEEVKKNYRSLFPQAAQKAVNDAEQLCNHHFRLLGLSATLPDPIQWNVNPQTDVAYPLVHFSQLDTYNTARYGDVKFVWELNRHQFFIELAKAYYLTGEIKYAEKIVQMLNSWMSQVPHKLGVNHTSVLEHAVRIFSWVWSYYFTKDAPVWTAETKETLAKALLLQGDIIEENLSYFYSPYNHLIGEIAALAFLGTVYPANDRLRYWRDHYWNEMEAQLPKQFHPDGFTVEQASYYHHFTWGFYLQVALLRQQNNLPVSAETWEWLEKSLQFATHLTRPDGRLPMLGDIDSARSIYFYFPDDKWDLRGFQALGAALFARGDMKQIAGHPSEELLWLTGSAGLADFDAVSAQQPEAQSQYFPHSGYQIMRDGWDDQSNYALFDCGEIAHGVHRDGTPSAAHGHSDMLSFELCLKGKPLIVDPGFYTYFGELSWHRYFRDAKGHNTITVNDCGHAVHEGRIAWSGVSTVKVVHQFCSQAGDFICAETDRFAGLNMSAKHRRYFWFEKNNFAFVFDEVVGEENKPVQIQSSLHFVTPEVALEENVLFADNRPVGIFALPSGAQLRLQKEADGPDSGWIAPGYGERQPAAVLRILAQQALPFTAAMVFPFGDKIQQVNQFTLLQSGDLTIYELNTTHETRRFYLNPSRQMFIPRSKNAPETDALMVMECQKMDGKPRWRLFQYRIAKSPKLEIDLKLDADAAMTEITTPKKKRTAAVKSES
jgi:hypothetical protein